jgi:hypothetical protein
MVVGDQFYYLKNNILSKNKNNIMNELIRNISVEISNDPITGLKRKLFHHRFEINENLEMIHYRKIVFYEKIENGTSEGGYGRIISEVITESDLNNEAKQLKLTLLAPQYLSVSTTNVYVNPLTGQPVEKIKEFDENNNLISENYPEGSVLELLFWQNLPKDFIEDSLVMSDVIYGLLKISMRASDNAKRI